MRLDFGQVRAPIELSRISIGLSVENLPHIAACYGDGVAARVLHTVCRRTESVLPDALGSLTIEPCGLRIQGWGWDPGIDPAKILPALLVVCERPIEVGHTRLSVTVGADFAEGFDSDDGGNELPTCFAINSYRADMEIAVAVYDAIDNRSLELVEYPLDNTRKDSGYPSYKSRTLAVEHENRAIGSGIFLSVLDRLRLTRAYDRYVVQSTIDRLKVRPDIKLGCDVSALSAVDDIWWTSIREELSRSPSIAARLVIEIREPTVSEKRQRMIGFVLAMQRLGCGVSFSGFGTGVVHKG